MITHKLLYNDNDTTLEAFVAYPSSTQKSPLVILCHAWAGRDNFIDKKAQELAHSGYTAFALDMYGKDVLGKNYQENAALKAPFMNDRTLLHKRIRSAFEVACSLDQVDRNAIAVVGFGFGGTCALDFARHAFPIQGAVSVYGHLNPPEYAVKKPINTKILALHGYNDPIVTPADVQQFQGEMNALSTDWQLHTYGNSFHAFGNPNANNLTAGILYNPITAHYAWQTIQNFLKYTVCI